MVCYKKFLVTIGLKNWAINSGHVQSALFVDIVLSGLPGDFCAEIMSSECDIDKIKHILQQSRAHPNTPVVNKFNGPCLLLTHLGADIALDNMHKVFSNLTVIKVVLDHAE